MSFDNSHRERRGLERFGKEASQYIRKQWQGDNRLLLTLWSHIEALDDCIFLSTFLVFFYPK